MALSSDGTNSNCVDHGNGGVGDAGNDTITWCGWFSISSLFFRMLWGKGRASDGSRAPQIRHSGASGDIEVLIDRASVDTQYITNDTPMPTTGKPYFVAVTFDTGGGAGEIVNIFVGDKVTPAVESSYGTATDGSGAIGGNSDPFCTANQGAKNDSLRGDVSFTAIYDTVLTLEEIIQQQFNTDFPVKSGHQLFIHYGIHGAGGVGIQVDWSGQNDGTLAGMTKSAHAPISIFHGPQLLIVEAPRRVFVTHT